MIIFRGFDFFKPRHRHVDMVFSKTYDVTLHYELSSAEPRFVSESQSSLLWSIHFKTSCWATQATDMGGDNALPRLRAGES